MKLTDKQQNILTTFNYPSPEAFLTHYPYRYDFLESTPYENWNEGDTVVFYGELSSSFRLFRMVGKRSRTQFDVVSDGNAIKVMIFNRPFLKEFHYTNGIVVVGTVGKNNMVIAKTVSNKPLAEHIGIKPSYPLKAGIKNFEIERLIKKILNDVVIIDPMPQTFKTSYKLYERKQAFTAIHQPQNKQQLINGLRTQKYDEFLRYHLSIALNNQHLEQGIYKDVDETYLNKLLNDLPFTLTDDQTASLKAICEDLGSTKQMNRLLQGDVSSGKTIVAFLSALVAIHSGYQVAFMAPTEILMNQHYEAFIKFFGKSISACKLSQSTEHRENVQADISNNRYQLILGTHALFSDDVVFANLGYVIIDEQHRFGVKQRQKLIQKGDHVDALMLSATPIPRTLANSLFFDLDVSTIATYPKHHKNPQTYIIEENSIRSIMDDLHTELDKGGQIYVVCPAIDEGERPGVKNVLAIHEQLSKQFKSNKVGLLHGKLKSEEKEHIMNEFSNHKIDILIATTVIEVGLDVHNANTMVIYNAEQFGLATLHQLRGRVGRGEKPGICYLLSGSSQDVSVERLKALESSYDGFELAMTDMRLRGFGDALGTRQSGIPSFILGDIQKDEKILHQAKLDAQTIISDIDNPEYAAILEIVRLQDYFKTT